VCCVFAQCFNGSQCVVFAESVLMGVSVLCVCRKCFNGSQCVVCLQKVF